MKLIRSSADVPDPAAFASSVLTLSTVTLRTTATVAQHNPGQPQSAPDKLVPERSRKTAPGSSRQIPMEARLQLSDCGARLFCSILGYVVRRLQTRDSSYMEFDRRRRSRAWPSSEFRWMRTDPGRQLSHSWRGRQIRKRWKHGDEISVVIGAINCGRSTTSLPCP